MSPLIAFFTIIIYFFTINKVEHKYCYYNKPWDYVLRFSEKNNENSPISTGQSYANIFLGTNIAVDGVCGTETMRTGIMVLQKAMNLDYQAGIAVDGIWGEESSEALGNHYVE